MRILQKKKKVVIVGGGFGGVIAAKELLLRSFGKFEITLVDKNDYHLFKSALCRAATSLATQEGKVSAIAIKFKDIFLGQKAVILKDELKSVDFDEDRIILKSAKVLEYDYLIISTGAEIDFKGVKGAQEHALPFQRTEDALAIGRSVEEAVKNKPKKENINLVVIGAGFTGCELAANLFFYLKNLAELYGHPKSLLSVSLIEAAERILPQAGNWTILQAEKRLRNLGVKIFIGQAVKAVEKEKLILTGDNFMPYDVLIWAAGNKPNCALGDFKFSVSPNLRMGRQKNVFVIEDVLCGKNSPISVSEKGTAQSAIRQAEYIAWLLAGINKVYAPLFFWKKPGVLPSYKTFKPVFMINLGQDFFLADFGFLKFKGILARWVRGFSFLNYFTRILPWRLAFKKYKLLKLL